MSDIFREVDEALNREKAAKFWKEYGPTLILGAVVMVASTGATTAYRNWNSSENKEQTSRLVQAAEQKDIAAAMEKAAADTDGGHKGIALLNAAAKYADQKDYTKAAELYDSLSGDKDVPQDLRDLGTIFYSRAALLVAGDKTPDYKALAERLAPVAANNKSAFHKQAKLESALLYGNGLKDYTKALELLQGFEDNSTEGSLKEKATALKHVYQYEVSKAQAAPKQ